MFKLWISIKKDVKVLLRDKVGLALMLGMPIVLVVVVTSIQNSTFQLINKSKIAVAVCNLDTGLAGRQLIKDIDNIGLFKVLNPTRKNADSLQQYMHDSDAMLGITIPQNFTEKVNAKASNSADKAMAEFNGGADSTAASAPPEIDPLQVYYNPVLQESLRFSVQGALQSALQLVESRQTLRTLYYNTNEKEMPLELEKQMLSANSKVNMLPTSKDGTRNTPNAAQHNVPAWTIFAMFFVVVSLGGSVVREKISGGYIRLKTLPTNYMVGILSKQITYLVVTLLQAAIIFSMGIWLFPVIGLPPLNIPHDVLALFVVTLVTGWCAVSYAICVGVFAGTHEQANGFGAISIVILACIGGLMVPSFAMQGLAKTLANFSPMHWCLQAYYKIFLEGASLTDVLTNLFSILTISLVLLFITHVGLKKKNLI
ncbi:ABC transporter permease [Mucilaginibacter auburnensis]|uniref:ABC-2 type transport system permease protein n=1 Tax=Mucilaginibacter auburnensis TaxID=1457233 RepID=A0A2H9VMI5_9SPHI|nr:ABC transporter permease [Mucilaginibacter auburnensis]PJJ79536.1 ABC-2 type transport system permease protein [Mucilaginibacter auburnensis]